MTVDYYAGYICRGGSVLLQQMSCGKRQVLLACVSDGGESGAYVTGRLRSWLQENIQLLIFGKEEAQRIQRELHRELTAIEKELAEYGKKGVHTLAWFQGVLLVGQEGFLFQSGGCNFYLFNRKFQRTHRRIFAQGAQRGVYVTAVQMQCSVGILLGQQDFLGRVSGDTMLQCLAVQEIAREEQIAGRLRELADESAEKGYSGERCAVYICSV